MLSFPEDENRYIAPPFDFNALTDAQRAKLAPLKAALDAAYELKDEDLEMIEMTASDAAGCTCCGFRPPVDEEDVF